LAVKPILQALLVADNVYTDKTTGKKIIAGVFHNIWFIPRKEVEDTVEEGKAVRVAILPAGQDSGSPFCYISLTEVHGRQRFSLRYVYLDQDEQMFSGAFEIDGASPLESVEVIMPLPRLPQKGAGTYALELAWNDEPLGSHRINVSPIQEEGLAGEPGTGASNE